MPTIRKSINNGNIGGNGDFKVQLASDDSGQYVEVIALDADLGISIGEVSQGAAGSQPWLVDPSGVTSPVSAAFLPLPMNAAQETGGNLTTLVSDIGSTADAAPASDTGTASLNGRLQRIAQRLSSLIALVPPALTGSGNFKVALVESTASQTVSGTVTANAGSNLNTSALALETGGNLATLGGTVSAGKVKVDPSGVTSPVSLASLPALTAGTNNIGGVYPAPTSSSSFAITPGSSSSLEASHVLKASAGNLYSLYVTTTSLAGYLMTFNATSAPSDGAVTPVECVYVPATSSASINAGSGPPDAYATGIVAVFSTTGPFTKTGSATAFFKWGVQ